MTAKSTSGNEQRGSEWHKWDLHLHSPKTFLNNQFKDASDDQFIEKIVREEIKLVGLTNYFRFVDGEIEEKDSLRQRLESKGITVFINIEFRLEQKNKDSDYINVHVLFSNNTNSQKIKDFLGRLKTIDGTYCRDLEPTESIIKVATLPSLDALIDEIENDSNLERYKDYIIIGCPNGYGGFRPGKDGRGVKIAQVFDSKCDAFYSSHENPDADQKFFLDDSRFSGAKSKPVFLASDTHSLDNIGIRTTWVKARPNFEGLIQTLHSPAERVSFNENKPSDIKSESMLIDKVTYGTTAIHFNPDLNSIIGVRGSGKSILLRSIAANVDENDYREKVGDDRSDSDISHIAANFKGLKIIWKDGEENSGSEENSKKVFFLPQGYLSNLAYDEYVNEKERDDFLIGLLRKNETFKNAEIQARTFIDTNSQELNVLVDAVLSKTDDIRLFVDESKSIGSTESIKKEIAALEVKIKTISKKNRISNKENENYQKARNVISDSSKSKRVIEQDIAILESLQERTDLVQISAAVMLNLSDTVRSSLARELKDQSEDKLKEIVTKKLESLVAERIKLDKQIKESQKVISSLKSKFDKQKELTDLTAKKVELDGKTKILGENQKRLKELTESKAKDIGNIKIKFFDFQKRQEAIFETVNFDDFEFIEIGIDIKNNASLSSQFTDRNINTQRLQNASKKSKDYYGSDKTTLNKDNFTEILTDIIDAKIVFKVDVKDRKQVIRDLLDNPYKIDFLDSIKTKNDKVLFRNMTGGQKAIAMLELIFKFDTNNYPILLDQPEDDLDTSGVASNVVDFIKQQKAKRQIFIVSHNGSLVVGADSEEVIVAKGGSGFAYQVGAIEDKKIRAEIVNVLEGGEAALKLRMNKLRVYE